MKKVFLNCVYKKNFGDDLFIYTLLNRYPKTKFEVINYRNGGFYPLPDNLKEINVNNILYRIFRKLGTITQKISLIDYLICKRQDLVVTIGGSMFMEPKSETHKIDYIFDFYSQNSKDNFILGANIGPVYTEKYIDNIKKFVLPYCVDISLRDTESINYLSGENKVRMAPDIIFSLDIGKFSFTPKRNKVIFSIIDINQKSSQIKNPNIDDYELLILKLIDIFAEKGYEITLMSFCKEEGDETAIERIIEKTEKQVDTYFYDGNIEEALTIISTATTIVGTRFHANILGFIFNKNVIPIIYNDKTTNMLYDINFKGKVFDINNIGDLSEITLNEDDLSYYVDVSKEKEEAILHFYKLDKILE